MQLRIHIYSSFMLGSSVLITQINNNNNKTQFNLGSNSNNNRIPISLKEIQMEEVFLMDLLQSMGCQKLLKIFELLLLMDTDSLSIY